MATYNQWHVEEMTLDLDSNTQGAIPIIYGRQGDRDGILCKIELTQQGVAVPQNWFNGKRVFFESRGNGISVRKQVEEISGGIVNVVLPESVFYDIGLVKENFLRVEDATTGNTIISGTSSFQVYVRRGNLDPKASAYYLQEIEDIVSGIDDWVVVLKTLLDKYAQEGQLEFDIWFKSIKEALYGIDPAGNLLRELIEARTNDSGFVYSSVKARMDDFEVKTNEHLARTATKKVEHISRGKQYAIVDLTTAYPTVKVQYKYTGDEDRWIVLERCGLNEIFSYSALYKNSSGNERVYPNGDFTNATLVEQFDTDILGPYQMRADNNADGDITNTKFTGGWHGYNGDQTGAPTASQKSVSVYADGKQLDGMFFEGYVDELYIVTRAGIQGYNTEKIDGTGREILTQEIRILVKEGKSEIHARLLPLESITFVQYYGPQLSYKKDFLSGSATIHYVNGDTQERKSALTANISGPYDTYPCNRIVQKNGTGDMMISWIDPTYGLGTRSHVKAGKNSAFNSGYKAYFYLISEAPFSIGAGSLLEWHGGLAWEKSPGGLTVADAYIKLLQNGNVWRVMDFLKAGTEFETPDPDEMFITANGVKELKKSANIAGFLANYFYSYSIQATGYGEYWFKFKRE